MQHLHTSETGHLRPEVKPEICLASISRPIYTRSCSWEGKDRDESSQNVKEALLWGDPHTDPKGHGDDRAAFVSNRDPPPRDKCIDVNSQWF